MSTTEQGASNEPQLIAGWLETSDGQYAGYYVHESGERKVEASADDEGVITECEGCGKRAPLTRFLTPLDGFQLLCDDCSDDGRERM